MIKIIGREDKIKIIDEENMSKLKREFLKYFKYSDNNYKDDVDVEILDQILENSDDDILKIIYHIEFHNPVYDTYSIGCFLNELKDNLDYLLYEKYRIFKGYKNKEAWAKKHYSEYELLNEECEDEVYHFFNDDLREKFIYDIKYFFDVEEYEKGAREKLNFMDILVELKDRDFYDGYNMGNYIDWNRRLRYVNYHRLTINEYRGVLIYEQPDR